MKFAGASCRCVSKLFHQRDGCRRIKAHQNLHRGRLCATFNCLLNLLVASHLHVRIDSDCAWKLHWLSFYHGARLTQRCNLNVSFGLEFILRRVGWDCDESASRFQRFVMIIFARDSFWLIGVQQQLNEWTVHCTGTANILILESYFPSSMINLFGCCKFKVFFILILFFWQFFCCFNF